MTDSKPSLILKIALYVLVPAAWLSLPFWQPDSAYGRNGHEGMPGLCTILMAAVLLVSLLSLGTRRLLAVLGLIACFLWLAVWLLPVL